MSSSFISQRYLTAREFIDVCASTLNSRRPAHSNLALGASYAAANSSKASSLDEWWISVAPKSGERINGHDILFTLTVMGTWPGVLACSVDTRELSAQFIQDAMQAMVERAISANLSPARLASITTPTTLGYPFTIAWARDHALTPRPEPILRFALSFVNRETFRPALRLDFPGVDLGYVREDEVEAAALLLVEFNQDMPRKVTLVNARQLAKKSVEDKQMYRAVIDDQMKAFVMVARHTPGAKAVSNVYTTPAARGKGLAETLVRYTVRSLLDDPGINEICLFVDPANAAAARVYGRIGFIGLETGIPDQRTEEWAELGFEGVALLDF